MSRKFKDIPQLNLESESSFELSLTILNAESETKKEVLERSIERPEGVVSTFYNSTKIHVVGFYKPISRPVLIKLKNEE